MDIADKFLINIMEIKKKRKKHKRFNENNFIFGHNKDIIIKGITGTETEIQVETGICFANYLNHIGITKSNYYLFLKLLESNNKWIMDALIGNRDARLLFSTIKPNKNLIKIAFRLLTFWHPKQIYSKVLLALLGIIECAYHKPDDGYRIYPLTINDLNNIGKYLDSQFDQFNYENSMVLEILDRITQIGEYRGTLTKSVLAKHAFHIRLAYFDNTKKLVNVIPQVLLIDINREETEVNPSKEFIRFLKASPNYK